MSLSGWSLSAWQGRKEVYGGVSHQLVWLHCLQMNLPLSLSLLSTEQWAVHYNAFLLTAKLSFSFSVANKVKRERSWCKSVILWSVWTAKEWPVTSAKLFSNVSSSLSLNAPTNNDVSSSIAKFLSIEPFSLKVVVNTQPINVTSQFHTMHCSVEGCDVYRISW